MAKLVSSLSSMPEDYILPVELRAGDTTRIPFCNNLPVIELQTALACGRHHAVQKLVESLQEFGLCQVINHGVAEDLMIDTMGVMKELFHLPNNDKESLYSEDPDKECKLYTSSLKYNQEMHHFWRDVLRLPCHPIDNYIHLWPTKPDTFRDVVTKYSLQMADLSSTILELICEGLGLEPGYFGGGLSGDHVITSNHYPPCPSPDLALGLPGHFDPNLITLLQQDDIYGLQMHLNGEWLGIKPIPNAFLLILGRQTQVISNGKLKSPKHRVLTLPTDHRTSIAYFIYPDPNKMIEPAKVLIDDSNPPLYQSFKYKTFLKKYHEKKDYNEDTLENFKLESVQ